MDRPPTGGGASSSSGGGRLPPRPSTGVAPSTGAGSAGAEAFPPPIERAGTLLRAGGGDPEQARVALEVWRGRLLEALDVALRGSLPDAPPIEEAWHWLSASERMARIVSFCEHADVVALAAEVAASGPEGAVAAERWTAALREARRAQRESGSNAGCLRVVEGPMKRLESVDTLREGALSSTVKSLMKSLQRIYQTAAYFKDERMAQLLRRILRSLVARASGMLPGAYEVSRPAMGLGAAFRTAEQLRDAFQAFIGNHFISEAAAAASPSSGLASPRPSGGVAAGSPSTRIAASSPGDGSLSARRGSGGNGAGTPLHSARRREASADPLGGWWRAANRASLEHAEQCHSVCSQVARLLEQWAKLSDVLPGLQAADPELLRDIESFRELHSGVKPGGSAAELLDPKHRVGATAALKGVEQRLQALVARAQDAGAVFPDQPSAFLADDAQGTDLAAASTTSMYGTADILVLPDHGSGEGWGSRPSTASATAAVHDGISSIQEDLRRFGLQLENRIETLAKKTAASSSPFAPEARARGAGMTPRQSPQGPAGGVGGSNGQSASVGRSAADASPERSDGEDDAAEYAAALEVARRSSWYHEPPPLLQGDVEMIEVRTKITQTIIHRVPSRPRTAHPLMTVTRPLPTVMLPSEPRSSRPHRPATAAPTMGGHGGGGPRGSPPRAALLSVAAAARSLPTAGLPLPPGQGAMLAEVEAESEAEADDADSEAEADNEAEVEAEFEAEFEAEAEAEGAEGGLEYHDVADGVAQDGRSEGTDEEHDPSTSMSWNIS
mmetsp:Transcript_27238/g.76610  ORF Transcript_27238/g.76610 Transcript_27238/m.76610 type:complete len:787 (+) Transcript_27238:80-2440(+)